MSRTFSHSSRQPSSWSTTTIVAFAALIAAVSLVVVSPDSPLHLMNARFDSATFMAAGRAWMCGLTPYVDFADSKGPLLWLIYGIGYLISRTDYLGVFAISFAAYTGTFAFVGLTAREYQLGRTGIATVMLLMVLAFFNPVFFNEVRAEDFAHLPVMASAYVTCRTRRSRGSAAVAAAVVGLCCGCLLMMKFNLAAMNLVWLPLLLQGSPRAGRALTWSMAGFAAAVVPFVVAMVWQGWGEAFVQEYFVNTVVTSTSLTHPSVMNYLSSFGRIGTLTAIVLAVQLVGIMWWALRDTSRTRWTWLAAALWFMVIVMLLPRQAHHFMILASFALPGALAIVSTLGKVRSPHVTVAALLAFATVTVQNFWSPNFHDNFRYVQRTQSRDEYRALASLIAERQQPRILYFYCLDVGLGMQAQSLPACQYWFTQAGVTEQMQQQQWECIRQRRADVVVSFTRNRRFAHEPLIAAGYTSYVAGVDNPVYTIYLRNE